LVNLILVLICWPLRVMCFLKGILPPKLVSLSIGIVCNLATLALHQLLYVHFLDFSPEMYDLLC